MGVALKPNRKVEIGIKRTIIKVENGKCHGREMIYPTGEIKHVLLKQEPGLKACTEYGHHGIKRKDTPSHI